LKTKTATPSVTNFLIIKEIRLKLIDALSILSRSSPYAVSTDRVANEELQKFKNYLYIKTEIESDFEKRLSQLDDGHILFLCGSSGDGKSEILNRVKSKYEPHIRFHLDATHSFQANKTAIQTLDELFQEMKEAQKPLVIGINIGMLGNFSVEGSDSHKEIKDSMKNFLSKKSVSQNHIYLDFEEYPKFKFKDKHTTSPFIRELLDKLTENTPENPFYVLYSQEINQNTKSKININFNLLRSSTIKEVIIETLLKVRLARDQFISARSLLDFIYTLLCENKYLFDNLFSETDSELSHQLLELDPAQYRSARLDEFILRRGLDLNENKWLSFRDELRKKGITDIKNAASYIRLFYVFRNEDIGNNYHHEFKKEFDDKQEVLKQYQTYWQLHYDFDNTSSEKQKLQSFYKKILQQAVQIYINRNSPILGKGVYFLGVYNRHLLAAELEVTPDWKQIKGKKSSSLSYFNAHITINNQKIPPIPVNINLLELLFKIINGYRPNKYDKNTIVLLDEVINALTNTGNSSKSLLLYIDREVYKLTEDDGGFIEVGSR
jgi:DNA phosphorothioation-dependent restriction protein DptF